MLTALTTEHFVIQTAANGASSDSAARAALYVFTLSSTMIAMGFASNSPTVFIPFVATVLPFVFVLGVLTFLRLVDAGLEYAGFHIAIARIRRIYRTLGPDAAKHFAPEFGRWPELAQEKAPVFGLGMVVAFLTTNASMVGMINSLVGGTGVTLVTGSMIWKERIELALLAGAATTIVLIVLFYYYQRWRYSTLKPEEAEK